MFVCVFFESALGEVFGQGSFEKFILKMEVSGH